MAGEADSKGFAGLVLEDDLFAGTWPTHNLATLATVVLHEWDSGNEGLGDCMLVNVWVCGIREMCIEVVVVCGIKVRL